MTNRFVIIAPTFNAEKTARQAILSLAAQSYDNWKLIVIDDASTDGTADVIKGTMRALGISDKLLYISNTEKKWEVENTLIALNMCDDDAIVGRLDMDDYLIDNTVLEQLNSLYSQNPNVEAIWTSHRWFSKDGLTGTNISAQLPPGADPYKHPWVSSHFKTWRKYVSNNVSDANYRGVDGEYFKRIGDQAFYLPVLKLAKQKGHFPLVAYAYRCDQSAETFQTEDAKFQAAEAQYLRSRGFIK